MFKKKEQLKGKDGKRPDPSDCSLLRIAFTSLALPRFPFKKTALAGKSLLNPEEFYV